MTSAGSGEGSPTPSSQPSGVEQRSPDPKEWDATTYDRLADPMTRWGTTVLERLELRGSETVLDAGCGSGRVTEILVERLPHGRVVALDASQSMIEEAHRRLERFGPSVRFVRCDLLDLSPEVLGDDEPVDAVLSTATFHWVPDHDRLFVNLASVLRAGGQLVAQCGAHGNIDRLLDAVRRVGEERRGTWVYATPEETVQRLEAAGFDVIDVWSHPEPTRIDPVEELETYLETVCLRAHVASMAADDRHRFVAAVAKQMPEPVIDYVRLNIVARKR